MGVIVVRCADRVSARAGGDRVVSVWDRLDEIQSRAKSSAEYVRSYIETGGEAYEIVMAERINQNARADVPALVAALRAVLDLHKPEKFMDSEETCSGCDIGTLDPPTWPCQTVRAVEAALGEEK